MNAIQPGKFSMMRRIVNTSLQIKSNQLINYSIASNTKQNFLSKGVMLKKDATI